MGGGPGIGGALLLLSLLCLSLLQGARAATTTFTITNGCGYPVWPGILSNAGVPPPPTTGFALAPGQSLPVPLAAGWSGRVWARTLCAYNNSSSSGSSNSNSFFSCVTGDCGTGAVECSGQGAAPPATLAEFTLSSNTGADNEELDFYDVSLVDGYNVPMLVAPRATKANATSCRPTGCPADVNGACPRELSVSVGVGVGASGAARVVACRSACGAFGTAEYCCSGPAHGTPATCAPTAYSRFFKAECPEAYSYAYDDATSTFTCAGNGGGYDVVFCPGESSGGKASPPASAAAAYPPMAFSSAGANPATTTSHAIVAVLLRLFIINPGL